VIAEALADWLAAADGAAADGDVVAAPPQAARAAAATARVTPRRARVVRVI